MSPPSSSVDRLGKLNRIVRWTGVLLGLQILQNLIGMALNLYVTVPTSPTFAEVFLSIPVLSFHILNGFLVVALAAVLLVLVRRVAVAGVTGWAVVLLVGVVVALQEGFAFVFTQDNAYSYGMEVGFLVAVAASAGVLYRVTAARSLEEAFQGTGQERAVIGPS